MSSQFSYFRQDLTRMLGKYKIRILHIWLSRTFWGIATYRLERGLYLLIGRPYEILRILFSPLIYLIQAYSNIDLNYKSDIKGGLLILHPAAGVVISGLSVIGHNLTLTGGNIIGAKPGCEFGGIQIGNDCFIGANAVIMGPLQLSDGITIGACACVVRSCITPNTTLVGVPAKEQRRRE